MRFHTALLALVASPSCLAPGVVDASSPVAHAPSGKDDSTATTTMADKTGPPEAAAARADTAVDAVHRAVPPTRRAPPPAAVANAHAGGVGVVGDVASSRQHAQKEGGLKGVRIDSDGDHNNDDALLRDLERLDNLHEQQGEIFSEDQGAGVDVDAGLLSAGPFENDRELSSHCPTDGNWVDCFYGYVRGTTGTTTPCSDPSACGNGCCIGEGACDFTTACIKKDENNPSCIGRNACQGAGAYSTFSLKIDNSCIGKLACGKLFYYNTNGASVVSLTNSCLCDYSCAQQGHYHCGTHLHNYAPLGDLPSPCGTSFTDIVGRSGFDTCGAPSASPSMIPSSLFEAPSTLPSNSPSSGPSTSSKPTGTVMTSCPAGYIDCLLGDLRYDSSKSCATACGTDCCVGTDACKQTTACIKKDGSCNGEHACESMGHGIVGSSYEIQISGPSCIGEWACSGMFLFNPNTGAVNLTDSCLCDYSCFKPPSSGFGLHCGLFPPLGIITPTHLDNLPACGNSFTSIIGRSGYDGCRDPSSAPSSNPTLSGAPSAMPSVAPSAIPSASSMPSSVPSSTPSSNPTTSSPPSAMPSVAPSAIPSASSMPSNVPSIYPSALPSALPSASAMPSSQPSRKPTPAPRPPPTRPPTRSPTKMPSSRPSGIPSAVPSIAASSTPSGAPSASPSNKPSLVPSSTPSTNPTMSRSPSTMPSSRPSALPSSPPSVAPSSTPSSEPSVLPSSSPTPECQDDSNFDQTTSRSFNFGRWRSRFRLRLPPRPAIFEKAICTSLKTQRVGVLSRIGIVSCCPSVLAVENADGGGRRLQINTANTTYIVDFTTNIVYTGDACNETCKVAFADAINSDMFGDAIQGSVVDLQEISTKSTKSGTSGGSTKSSKSGTSGGSLKGSKISGNSMKISKSGTDTGGSSF